MSLTRTTLGVQALHVLTAKAVAGVTTAFNAANWTGQNTGTGTITVDANGRLVCGIGGVSGIHAFRYNAVQALADCCVMAVFNTTNVGGQNFGVLARLSTEATPLERLTASIPITQGSGGTFQLNDTTGGAASGSSTAPGNRNITAPMARAVLAAGSTAQAWMEAPFGASPQPAGGVGAANLSLTNINASGSWSGVGMSTFFSSTGSLTVSEFCLLRNRLLTVTGPTTGNWRVRLKNSAGTIIAVSDVQLGGTATIDILGNNVNNLATWLQRDPNYAVSGTELSCVSAAASIEIWDDDTTTIVQAPVSPSERVWPGDAWSWVPSVWPPLPTTLTRTTTGRLFAFSANPVAGITNAFSPFDWANGVGYSDSVRIDMTGGTTGLLAFRFSGTNFRPLLLTPASRNHSDIWLRARPEQRAGTSPSVSTASINARAIPVGGAANLAGLNGVPSALGGVASNSGVYERSTAAGAPVVQSSVQSTSANTPLVMDLLVIGTTAKYMQSTAGFTEKTLTGVAAAPGDVYLGESGANNVVLRWEYCVGERSNIVQVQGLPVGMTVDVLNAANAIVASGTANAGGVASIDLRAASVGIGVPRSVRINDGSTPVATPSDGVWGGDIWVYAVSGPDAARAVRRKFGARNLLLKR